MTFIRIFIRTLPTLAFAFVMAVAVWVTAVTAQDPNEQNIYPRGVNVEFIGPDPGLVIIDDEPRQVSVTINAPASVWRRLRTEPNLVRAVADLTGLEPGTHSVEVDIFVNIRPYEVRSRAPQFISVTLETFATVELPVNLLREGEPAIGFQVEEPRVNPEVVTISGPESQVSRIQEVRAVLNLGNAHDNITANLAVTPLDANEEIVRDVDLNPERVTVVQAITQQGGYRNVVVRPVVEGNIDEGYRLTNISVSPPAVTLFSADPLGVSRLPGFIETMPVNIEGANDDLDIIVPLNLPDGIEIVGDAEVLVQIGIAALESSITLPSQRVELVGPPPDFTARIRPETVDVILFGPVPALELLKTGDLRVWIDVSNVTPGVYQLTPMAELRVTQLQILSIVPSTIETVIEVLPTPTATPSP